MEGATLTRRATNLKRKSGSRLPKKSAKSASTTHRAPAFTSLRMTSNAWRAARLGLNPNEHGRELAWKNGSNTSLAACAVNPVRQPNFGRSRGWQRKVAGLRGEEFEVPPSFPLALARR
jgi:hypothetical protein